MKYAIQRHFGFASVIAGGLFAVACESEPLLDPNSQGAASSDPTAQTNAGLNGTPLAMSPAERADFERENGQVRCRESGGPSDLAIRWEKPPETSQTELRAIVTNNSAASITAEPVLIAANPSLGENRERRLAAVTVAPGTETAVSVRVADFPVQSVGEATSVSIGVRWKRQNMQEMVSPQALSEPLFVTHDDDSFRTAVLRGQEAELGLQMARATSVKTGNPQPVRRLLRALDLAGAREFRAIERADLPTPEVSAPALAEATNVEGREP